MSDFNQQVIEEFRSTGGKVAMFNNQNAEIVLMTTIGAKSGERRTSPVAYYRDGDRIVVIASNGGSDRHPAWYHNLKANPDLTVEVGTETYAAVATEVESEQERRDLYDRMSANLPGFKDYEAATERRIPVLTLSKKAQ